MDSYREDKKLEQELKDNFDDSREEEYDFVTL